MTANGEGPKKVARYRGRGSSGAVRWPHATDLSPAELNELER